MENVVINFTFYENKFYWIKNPQIKYYITVFIFTNILNVVLRFMGKKFLESLFIL